MFEEIGKLICSRWDEYLENSVTAIILARDPVGNWDFADFKVVFANKVARELMPNEIRSDLEIVGDARLNAMKSHWKTIQQHVEAGEKGFIGPFPYSTETIHENTVHLEFNASYIGSVKGERIFWVTTFDKTAEEYHRRMGLVGYTPRRNPLDKLSDRERSVCILVSRGLLTKEIAEYLGISERTVDNHRYNIRKKLNLLDRSIPISQYLRDTQNT